MLKQGIYIGFILLSIFSQLWGGQTVKDTLPEGFVYIRDIDSTILEEVRYHGISNFIGSPIDGYITSAIIISKPAAKALSRIQQNLRVVSKSLKIFDAYRPQKAVLSPLL